jgi:hypothetical protein
MQLHKAVRAGDLDKLRALLAQGAPLEARDREQYTPLMRAAERGQLETCRALLEAGADPLATDNNGVDALYIACCGGSLDIARELLQRGARLVPSISNTAHMGYTPLMGAVLSGNLEMVRFLVEAGADVSATARSGHTALRWASEFGHKHIYRYLKEQGATLPNRVKTAAGPLPAPVVPVDPSNRMQVLRAQVQNFPLAAAQEAFQEVLRHLRQITAREPLESVRRPGVYRLALNRKRLRALAAHYRMAVPTFRAARVEDDVQCVADLLQRLQRDVCTRGYLLMVEALWNIDEPIQLRLYPTAEPYAVLVACRTNGDNYGLSTARVIAWLRHLEQTHPFILTSCSFDALAGDFVQPVFDAPQLARKMYRFCPDIVEQGTRTVRALARSLEESQSFFFWWD